MTIFNPDVLQPRRGGPIDATRGINKWLADGSWGLRGREATLKKGADGEHVFGTGCGDDDVSVRKVGCNRYEVTVNGETWYLTREQLENAKFDLGSGNDRMVIDDSVDVPLQVEGGDGDDTIINRADGIDIRGGDGDDTIISQGNRNTIRGGRGNDRILSVGHGNVIEGGCGWDQIGVLGHFNRVDGGRGVDSVWMHGFGNRREDFDWNICPHPRPLPLPRPPCWGLRLDPPKIFY